MNLLRKTLPEGFPFELGIRCSVQLSYGRLGRSGSLHFGGWRCAGLAAADLRSPFSAVNILAGL